MMKVHITITIIFAVVFYMLMGYHIFITSEPMLAKKNIKYFTLLNWLVLFADIFFWLVQLILYGIYKGYQAITKRK